MQAVSGLQVALKSCSEGSGEATSRTWGAGSPPEDTKNRRFRDPRAREEEAAPADYREQGAEPPRTARELLVGVMIPSAQERRGRPGPQKKRPRGTLEREEP